jgi:hypothetical protein
VKLKIHWNIDEILSVPFGPDGPEAERRLQIASGAMFIALLTLLGSSWSDATEPKFALQVATILPLGLSGAAFLMAMGLTQGRLLGGPNGITSILWYISCVFALGFLIASGWVLTVNVVNATRDSADAAHHQLTDIENLTDVENQLETLQSTLKQIEARIGAESAQEKKEP